MKILYISQYFPPEMGAPAARVAELSILWTEAGHDVTVLTGFPNHPTGVVPPPYRDRMRHLVARERFNGIDVIRTLLLPLPNRKPYERILNYSSFATSAAGTGMFLSRPDVVIATSPQLLTGITGWWLARWKRVPFILEIRDLWPESLAAVGMGKQKGSLYRTLETVAAFLYRRCDHVVVVTSAFREALTANWSVPPDKISVVENGVDTNLFRPLDSREMRTRLRAEGKFVVSYIGTMGMAQGLETLIEAAERVQACAPGIQFLFVGQGAEKQRIAELVRHKALNNLLFVDQQPREKIPAYIAASDLCLVPLRNSGLFKTVLPTKLLEFMACGKPVIVGVDGLARDMVEDANAGIFVKPQDSSALAGAILHLSRHPELCSALGENGRKYILQKFTRRRTAETYLRVLEEVIGGQLIQATAAA
ncbi:MAG: glycosyltransferase family 4 protein [Acidobacteriaceae bacterium]|nr:glycosyltransferase family 4 protein [Acidobacteriaceae bacterium]